MSAQVHRSRVAALFFLFLLVSAAEASEFLPLGVLPGEHVSRVHSISADGTYVVGQSTRGFVWTRDVGMTDLGVLIPNGESIAQDVSNTGVVCGESDSKSGLREAFRWTARDGMQAMGFLSGGDRSNAYGISRDGSTIVGSSASREGTQGFRYTADDGMVGLGGLSGPPVVSIARRISADGSVIAGYGSPPKDEVYTTAIRWVNGTIERLDNDGGNIQSSLAFALSGDGLSIVGSARQGGRDDQPALWKDGKIRLLADLGYFASPVALCVTDDGATVGGAGFRDFKKCGFLWSESRGMRLAKDVLESDYGLDLTDWQIERVSAISADGRVIAGDARGTDGVLQGFVAHVPEPGMAAMVLFAACLLRRRG